MTVSLGKTEARSLLDLTKLADELVEPFTKEGVYSTKALLMKALECIEVYKANVDSKDKEKCEESFICYTAASRLVSEIIPHSKDFASLDSNKNLWQFYNDLVDYLVRKRDDYDHIRNYLQSTATGNDSLLSRFRSLKDGASTRNVPDGGLKTVSTVESMGVNRSGNSSSNNSNNSNNNNNDDTSKNASSSSINSSHHSTDQGPFNTLNKKTFITVDELAYALDRYPTKVLVVDFRRKREFDLDHIMSADNLIQLEPVSVRESYTCKDIEDYSMVTNSDEERYLFASRSIFQLVVCLDNSSTQAHVATDLQRLVRTLQMKADGKVLKGHPMILDGGFEEWERLKDGITAPECFRKPVLHDTSIDMISNGRSTYDERKLVRNVSEYFSKPRHRYNSTALSPNPVPNSYSLSPSASPQPLLPRQAFHSTASPSNSIVYANVSSSMQMPSQQSGKRRSMPPSIPNKPSVLPPPVNPQALVQMPNTLIMTGLVNLRNSCYMNSGLQCLMGTSKLIQFFLTGNYRRHVNVNSRLGSKGILANEFASICMEMYRNTNESHPTYISPLHFRRVLASLKRAFNNCDQQDCAEFVNYVLDSLHEDLNENGNHPKLPELSKEEEIQREALPIRIASTIEWERYLKTNFSIIVDIFQGQMMSQLRCLNCGATSTTYNSFSTLSLPIPKNSKGKSLNLEDCFDEFVRPEILDGDDKWLCPRCKTKQRASKQLCISRLPQILCVHLKRFRMDNYLTKINNYIGYGEQLQLDKYWPQVKSEFEKMELSKLPVRGQLPPFEYKLFGVINHYGNLINGHYTAFVRKGRHGWCLFDDQTVTKHCKTSKVINGDAYILFYERQG